MNSITDLLDLEDANISSSGNFFYLLITFYQFSS